MRMRFIVAAPAAAIALLLSGCVAEQRASPVTQASPTAQAATPAGPATAASSGSPVAAPPRETVAAAADRAAARLGIERGPGEAATLAAAASQTRGGRRLSGAEYRRLAFGNTLWRPAFNGGSMTVHITAEGRQVLRLVNATGQTLGDRGTIVIEGDRVCSRWERIAGGRLICFAYFLVDGGLIAVDLSGQAEPTRFELRPGNPENI
jgi:hypothetical protein